MRNRELLVLSAVMAAAAFLAGCNNQKSGPAAGPKLSGPILASVDGDKLTAEELDSLSPQGFSLSRENLPKILDKWVSNTLMYQEARRRGIDKEPQVQAHLKRLERDYLVNALLERLTENAKAGEADVMAYYNLHKDEFAFEVKIQRIIMPDSMMAVATLADIRSGGDFTKLAKERSRDMLLEGGQESRYFARGVGDPRMGGDPALEEVIFSLAPGQVSDVLSTQEGYQIVKLVDKKRVKTETSLAETKDYIEAVLSYRRSQLVVDSVLTELRAKAKIEMQPGAYFSTPAGK